MTIDHDAVKAVFLEALERPMPADRAAFLDQACGGNAGMRQCVEKLLELHDQPDPFLDRPAAAHFPVDDAISLHFLETDPEPGSLGRLGHYRILEVVGRGGMGVVLRAFDEKLQRVVAIKALAPGLAGSGASRQRFVREARAAAAVTHDNVIAIYAVEDTGPVPYLVMQFIHGCTLQEKLDRVGPLHVQEILRLAIGIADGLAAAHRHGLVHRDVKPANILLENGVERVKITDFGLARAVDDASLTRSGIIAGTPAYMSPEQAGGERVDHRSDLFSLGSVLYALCTGHPPFRADTTMAVLKRVCDDSPRPIREINSDIPEWLAAVVAKLQAKDPGQRFETAAEVGTLLSRRLTQLKTGAEISDWALPASATSRPRKKLFSARRSAVALAVVGFLLAAWLTRDRWQPAVPPQGSDAAPSANQPEPWKPRPLLSADELAKLPDPLDDWRRDRFPASLLASVTGGEKDAIPELVGVLGDGPFRVPRLETTHWPTQSSDGRLLALPCGNTVVLYDAATGATVRTLAGHEKQTYVGDFTADGKRFACGSDTGVIRVWDVGTGKEAFNFHDDANLIWGTVFSRDGRRIVTVNNLGAVKVWDAADGKELKTLGRHKGGATFLAFNSAGTRLATAGLDNLVKVWAWPSGDFIQGLEGHPDVIQCLSFSTDDTLLASGSYSRVTVWDAANLRPKRILETAGGGLLGFTPDGRTLVAGPHQLPDGQKRAFTRWDVETGTLAATREVPGPRNVMCGRLSRDGRDVYMMSYAPPEPRLGAYDAATGAERHSTAGHAGLVWNMAFRPDGRMLASGGVDGSLCLWDLDAQPGGFGPPGRMLTRHGRQVWSVTFSSDGKLLASGSVDGTVRVWDVATGQLLHDLSTGATQSPASVALSPDGETLAAGGGNGNVHLWAMKSGQPQEPVRWHVGPVIAVAFSPDGRWLASGGIDRTVQLIDRGKSQRVHTFRMNTPTTMLAFSADSQVLLGTVDGPDAPVRLWDVLTKSARTLTGPTRPVPAVAFDPGGRRVASTSLDGIVRFWDAEPGGEPRRTLDFHHLGPTAGIAFSPSGRHVAIGLGNGLIAIVQTTSAR